MNALTGNITRNRVFMLLVFAASLFCIPQSDHAQSFSLRITDIDVSQFPIVKIKYNVLRDNLLIPNLSNAQFQLMENNIAQQLQRVDCASDSLVRLSIGLLIDRSGSMAQKIVNGRPVPDIDTTKLKAAKAAVEIFIDRLGNKDEAAVFSFSSNPPPGQRRYNFFDVNRNFTLDKIALKDCLYYIKADGGTYLWRAINETIARTRLQSGRKFIVVLTDGKSGQGDDSRNSAINNAIGARIPIYTIGLGEDVSESDLSEIANRTGGKYFRAPDASTLADIYIEIAKIIITDGCELQYISSNACFDGSRRDISLSVRLGNNYAEIDTFFTVPLKKTLYTVAAENNVSITAGDKFEIPIYIREILSSQEDVSFDVTINYDTSLLSSPKIIQGGTISEGAVLTVQEPTPGILRVSMQNHPTTIITGSLFRIEFQSQVTRKDTSTQILFGAVDVHQRCPSSTLSEIGSIAIIPCRVDYHLHSDSLIIQQNNQTFSLPIYLQPPPRYGEHFAITFDVAFQTDQLTFSSLDTKNSQAAFLQSNASIISPGILRITLSGMIQDTTAHLVHVNFTAMPLVVSASGRIGIFNTDLTTRCITTMRTNDLTLLINGACEQIIKVSRRKPFFTSTPNPFNPQAVFLFNVLRSASVRLTVYNSAGEMVNVLLDQQLPAGEYRVPFDGAALPSGNYFALLTVDGSKRFHQIVLVR